MTDPLPPIAVDARVAALGERMAREDVGSVVVTDPLNIRYLCGFTGSAAVLVVGASGCRLLTDPRYDQRAVTEIAAVRSDAEVILRGPGGLAEALDGLVEGPLGLDGDHLSHNAHARLAAALDLPVVDVSGWVEDSRATKSPAEVARVRRAAAIAADALGAVLPMVLDRPTERDVALELDYRMRRSGADDVGYEPIVAAGPNASVPHHEAGRRTVSEGDLLIVDVGAEVDGYRSDMTRTFAVGDPDGTQRDLFEVVCDAQAAGVAAVAAGVAAADVDAACRTRIDAAGHGDRFTHGTGHGVGLAIHERPAVSAASEDVLAAGNVLTVEPGVYVEGVGGVRVEDTVLVTDAGVEVLTEMAKTLAVQD